MKSGSTSTPVPASAAAKRASPLSALKRQRGCRRIGLPRFINCQISVPCINASWLGRSSASSARHTAPLRTAISDRQMLSAPTCSAQTTGSGLRPSGCSNDLLINRLLGPEVHFLKGNDMGSKAKTIGSTDPTRSGTAFEERERLLLSTREQQIRIRTYEIFSAARSTTGPRGAGSHTEVIAMFDLEANKAIALRRSRFSTAATRPA